MYDLQAIELIKVDKRKLAAAYRLDVAKQLGQSTAAELLDEIHDAYFAEVLADALADFFPEMSDEEVDSLVQDAVENLRPPED